MLKPLFTASDCNRTSYYEFIISNDRANLVQDCISLGGANAKVAELLAKGVKVSGYIEPEYQSHHFSNGQFGFNGKETHTAILLNIEPIEQDSERKVLEDLVRYQNSLDEQGVRCSDAIPELSSRARKLLEKKG